MEDFQKKDALEEIQSKYHAYNAALDEARKVVVEARGRLNEAITAVSNAADLDNAAVFTEAKQKMLSAETALEMAELRENHISAKSPVPYDEICAAIADYRQQIADLNSDACREIISVLTALNAFVKEKNAAAKEISIKLRSITELTGVDAGQSSGFVSGYYIWAAEFLKTPIKIPCVERNYSDLHRFARKNEHYTHKDA